MKESRATGRRIIAVLEQAEAGPPVQPARRDRDTANGLPVEIGGGALPRPRRKGRMRSAATIAPTATPGRPTHGTRRQCCRAGRGTPRRMAAPQWARPPRAQRSGNASCSGSMLPSPRMIFLNSARLTDT